ncbi:Two-component system regulatory protein [Desulfamplus magnetovallimortis]|uniref:Two-component system regulatory protein n=1 Tax=Desulfamplus magnetovallimortis TaxID=1246637 RepID=A0A1W1HIA0_9BACT|nr:HD domain-containing phosphohydrolase [Desulfamplus magnetovallimortis]SLM32237.1 Two-component system regulatory protein [Desulfamplus magnetovallimortis]
MNNHKWRILIVDDEPNNLQLMRHILGGDYQLSFAINGLNAIEVALKVMPDIILMDVMMPKMDGYEACRRLKSHPETASIPVIFITAMCDTDDESRGFEAGGVDYITKPVSKSIVRARVASHLALHDQQVACEKRVLERTAELEESQRSAVFMLGEAGDYNDTDTGVHIWRMAAYSGAIARCFGWSVQQTAMLELASPMHDIGKVGIPDEILKKKGPLSDDEWRIMRTHPKIGHSILSKCNTPLFTMAADVAMFHHEKWDGSGYPRRLKKEDIPEAARIVAVADVFDALTMIRPYKDAWPVEEAVEEIRRSSGTHFDPAIVECFLHIEKEVRSLKNVWDTTEQRKGRLYGDS